MTSHILQSMTIRAICPNGEVWSIRTRATVGNATGLRSLCRRASAFLQSVAVTRRGAIGNWIAAMSSLGSVARALSDSHYVARLGPFLQQGLTGFSNLLRRLWAAGSPSRVAFVNDCRQPTSRIFFRFIFPPVPFVAAASHDENSSNGVRACPTKEFPKTEKRFPRIA